MMIFPLVSDDLHLFSIKTRRSSSNSLVTVRLSRPEPVVDLTDEPEDLPTDVPTDVPDLQWPQIFDSRPALDSSLLADTSSSHRSPIPIHARSPMTDPRLSPTYQISALPLISNQRKQ